MKRFFFMLLFCLMTTMVMGQNDTLRLESILESIPDTTTYYNNSGTLKNQSIAFPIDTNKTKLLTNFTPDSIFHYYKKIWGCGLENYTFKLTHKEARKNWQTKKTEYYNYSYNIFYKNVPLYERSVGLKVVNDNIVTVIVGQSIPKQINLDTKPKLSHNTIRDIAMDTVGIKEKYIDYYRLTFKEQQELKRILRERELSQVELEKYYPKGVLSVMPINERIHLVYVFKLFSIGNSWYVVVDAHTGAVLFRRSMRKNKN